MNPGMTGAIIGGVGGLAGGIIGTWFSIRNTNGPRERAFTIRMSALTLCSVLLFLTLLFALPRSLNWLLWGPYMLLLVIGISYWNRRQAQIRKAEANNADAGASKQPMRR